MPRRTDIKKILIIGSGPAVIGQACEFDYAVSQACKALREEGYEIVVVDSNPATIATDPGVAHRTYIEPLTLESIRKIIEKERPDALLATLGGQTSLNLGLLLSREGVLRELGCELIGADEHAIARTEDPELFGQTMQSIGNGVPRGRLAESMEDGVRVIKDVGFPAILRPAYTVGGAGSAIAYNLEEFAGMLAFALDASPTRQVLIEESVHGWKQIGFELLRDHDGKTVAVISMEAVDPAGVHHGDSITVAPAQTLDAAELRRLIGLAQKVVEAVGVVGCAHVRFAVHPGSGDAFVIGLDPRASRDSAFASKATGLPIARIAAKLAVGLTLDEMGIVEPEPPADRCAVRVPRFDFERFPQADTTLNTSMKAVGEAMSIGRDFKEALQKGIRSIETGHSGLGSDATDLSPVLGPDFKSGPRTRDVDLIREGLVRPNADRLLYVRCAIEDGMSTEDIRELSKIDPWFIERVRELVEFEKELTGKSLVGVPAETLQEAKQLGYSDVQLAALLETDEEQVRTRRRILGIQSGFQGTDAGVSVSPRKVIILGSGPNRIEQGAEFDYCCVHAAQALQDEGCEAIIINNNPSAVSTDPFILSLSKDSSLHPELVEGLSLSKHAKVYLDPLTCEDVLGIVDREKPMGVVFQFGGRNTPNLVPALKKAGVPVLGTSPEQIDRAENPRLFSQLVRHLGLKQIGQGDPSQIDEPVEGLLEDTVRVGVDAISDGETTLVCGVMEHIEQAGVHSGDSACSLPPYSLPEDIVQEIKRQTYLLAKELEVRGLMNVQYAVKNGEVYILEVNPRASRTVPFVGKTTGIPWASVAMKIMIGKSLKEQGITEEVTPKHVAVKEAVFPFVRFPGVDVVLGPEMRSTGEVMGIDMDFGHAFIKAEVAAGQILPDKGNVFLSLSDLDKRDAAEIGRKLVDLGFEIIATNGTAKALKDAGVPAKLISKIGESRPDATDLIKNDEIALVINTPSGKRARQHEVTIRSTVVARGIPIITTIAGARATLLGMEVTRKQGATVRSLQEYGGRQEGRGKSR